MLYSAIRYAFWFITFFTCVSCAWRPTHSAYDAQYAYLAMDLVETPLKPSEYFLVLLTDARHLDYSHCRFLLASIAKNPLNGSKEGSTGHAWVYLKGHINGVT